MDCVARDVCAFVLFFLCVQKVKFPTYLLRCYRLNLTKYQHPPLDANALKTNGAAT